MLVAQKSGRAIKKNAADISNKNIGRESHDRNDTDRGTGNGGRHFCFLEQGKIKAAKSVDCDRADQDIAEQDPHESRNRRCQRKDEMRYEQKNERYRSHTRCKESVSQHAECQRRNSACPRSDGDELRCRDSVNSITLHRKQRIILKSLVADVST